jgi:hypothetical protein
MVNHDQRGRDKADEIEVEREFALHAIHLSNSGRAPAP